MFTRPDKRSSRQERRSQERSDLELLLSAGSLFSFVARHEVDDLVGEGGVADDGADDRERLGVAKEDAGEVTEEHEEPVHLEAEPKRREQEPADDDHDEPAEKDSAADDLAFAQEEAAEVLGAHEGDEAHNEGEVADAEKAAVKEKDDAEEVENKADRDEAHPDFLRVVIKEFHFF